MVRLSRWIEALRLIGCTGVHRPPSAGLMRGIRLILDEPHGVIESMNAELTVSSVRVNKLQRYLAVVIWWHDGLCRAMVGVRNEGGREMPLGMALAAMSRWRCRIAVRSFRLWARWDLCSGCQVSPPRGSTARRQLSLSSQPLAHMMARRIRWSGHERFSFE